MKALIKVTGLMVLLMVALFTATYGNVFADGPEGIGDSVAEETIRRHVAASLGDDLDESKLRRLFNRLTDIRDIREMMTLVERFGFICGELEGVDDLSVSCAPDTGDDVDGGGGGLADGSFSSGSALGGGLHDILCTSRRSMRYDPRHVAGDVYVIDSHSDRKMYRQTTRLYDDHGDLRISTELVRFTDSSGWDFYVFYDGDGNPKEVDYAEWESDGTTSARIRANERTVMTPEEALRLANERRGRTDEEPDEVEAPPSSDYDPEEGDTAENPPEGGDPDPLDGPDTDSLIDELCAKKKKADEEWDKRINHDRYQTPAGTDCDDPFVNPDPSKLTSITSPDSKSVAVRCSEEPEGRDVRNTSDLATAVAKSHRDCAPTETPGPDGTCERRSGNPRGDIGGSGATIDTPFDAGFSLCVEEVCQPKEELSSAGHNSQGESAGYPVPWGGVNSIPVLAPTDDVKIPDWIRTIPSSSGVKAK